MSTQPNNNQPEREDNNLAPDVPTGSVNKNRQRVIVLAIVAFALLLAVFVVKSSDGKKRPKAIANAAKAPNASLTSTAAVSQYQQNLDQSISDAEKTRTLAASQSGQPSAYGESYEDSTKVHPGVPFGTINPTQSVAPTVAQSPFAANRSAAPGQVGAPGYGPVPGYNPARPGLPAVPPSSPDARPFYLDPAKREEYAYGPNRPGVISNAMPTQEDELEKEHRKRVYEGRYLTNVAMSKRDDKEGNGVRLATQPIPAPGNLPQGSLPPVPQAATGSPTGSVPSTEVANRQEKLQDQASGEPAKAKRPTRQPGTYYIPEGTTLNCVLENRLNGDFSGPVKVMVSEPLYDRSRERVLIPAGTVLLGEEKAVAKVGQSRLAVSFHRMMRPDGYNVDLDSFIGLNQIGETALKDKVDHHYVEIFGVSIALGAISGFASSNTNSGYNQTGSDQFRQGFSQSLDNSAMRILDRYTNILPTVVIREGTRVNVYFTNDLYLPPADLHPILD